MLDITALYQAKQAAIARYLACERADQDTPYRDMRRNSRETVEAHWNAIDAVVTYRLAIDAYHRHRAFWLAVYILTEQEESEIAA
jgi:hypothetical protein